MILVKQVNGNWVRWAGETNLDANKVASLISESIWTEDDYVPLGIKIAVPFVVPENKIISGDESFVENGGVVSQVFEVTDQPPPTVPEAISPLQARKALRIAGLKAAVDAYIATLPEEDQEAWEYAVEVRRDNPIILSGAAALGISQAQLDDLFLLGATL